MLGSHCVGLAPHPSRQSGAAFLLDPQHLRRILEHVVAPVFAVACGTLWQPTRGSPPQAFARQVAMYLVHVGLGLSQRQVGHLFARDHRTVAHACAVVEDRRDCARLDRALDLLEGALVHVVSPRPV